MTDVDFFFEISIKIGCLLVVGGHALTFMQVCIMEESWPEHLNVLHLQGCQQSLLLIDGVVAVVVGEQGQQVDFYQRVVAGQSVVGREHMENGLELFVLLYKFWVLHISLVLLCPVGIVFRLFQNVDVFLCNGVFAIHQRAFQHITIVVNSPTIFNTILKTPAVAEIQLSIV